MYKLCLAALIAFAVPSVATAGGGGSKELGKIRIHNGSGQIAYVTVDPSNALKNATPDNFVKLGGRILNPGESTEFKNLKDGNHTVFSALKNQGDVPDAGDFSPKTVSTRKGVTTNVNAF
ncbi:hypothetical protein [Novipirellula sp.]|uniref:hypothetical protein n=1 Tax=Novipirellula sp. TaxID=2795430 RepID=UPI003563FDF5